MNVSVWQERDRLHICLEDDLGNCLAEWWDEDARAMFDDGFFEWNRLDESVVEYWVGVNGSLKPA